MIKEAIDAEQDHWDRLRGYPLCLQKVPILKIVTSEIDVALNEEFRVIPGMGEFGDRYFGTDD
ncbi:hypothetical protein NC652_004830 [Populus alba x Populus x berolinensis]|nr:hypothetical protein NC652_004830 [Populus alba x Populus x berolinensis]